MNSMMRSARWSMESNSPCRMRRRSMIENHSSTWLSHEACVGVRCRNTCGCSSRNASTAGVPWAERLSTMQCSCIPAGGLVDQVGEEGDEVLGASGVGDPPGDAAIVHVEGGEQLGGAVAAV